MLPLYRIIHKASAMNWDELLDSATAHPGLDYDKFANGWQKGEDGGISLPDNAKKDFFSRMVSEFAKCGSGLAAGLKMAQSRHRRLIETLNGVVLDLKTDWRFISGLGSSHPYETGFIWHRTLGVPYLPGSSVKGMVRSWAEDWDEEWTADDGRRKDAVCRLFGPESTGAVQDRDAAGRLVFFDALPVTPPKLEVDILNPHYQPYYADGKPPADYYNPVPVFFLTVAGGQMFRFSVAPRPGAYYIKKQSPEEIDAEMQKDVETGKMLLKNALKNLGAGGKTAVGYGRFTSDHKKTIGKPDKEIWKDARLEWDSGPQTLKAICGDKSAEVKLSDAAKREEILGVLPEGMTASLLKKMKKRKTRPAIIWDVEVEPKGPNFEIKRLAGERDGTTGGEVGK